MTAGPPTTLEGWLTKDKKSKGFGFGSSETRRWFKVKAITPDPGSKRSGGPAKMALCYYKSDRDREPRGWMFLRDITAIREAGPKCFVVEHPSRSYVLHAATTGEHADWVAGLKELVADAQGATKAKPAPAKAPPKKLEDPALYEYGSLYDDGRGEPPRDRYDDDHDRYRGDADARRRDDDRDRDRGYDGAAAATAAPLADEMDDILNDGPASPSPEKPAPKRAAFDFVPPERDDAPRGRGARHAPEWEDEDESAFRCGDAVVVQGSRGEPSREGVVVRVRPGERYDVDYDRGGDREGRVPGSALAFRDGDRHRAGDKVLARCRGGDATYPGTVRCGGADGTYDVDYDDGDRERGVPPAHVRALKQRSPKKPEPLARRSGDDSPQFDDEIDLGAEALDDTAARRRARGPVNALETPPAASAPPAEAPKKRDLPAAKIARRAAGGDELDIQWGDGSKPRKSKPKSALAKRLEEGGSRKPSKRSRAKPEKRVDDSDDENVEDDLLAERERLNRIKALADARRDSAKAAKKKVADKEKESKKKKKDKAEDSKPKAPSLFGGVRPDDGFVDDDWDASLDSPAARKALPAKGGPIGGFGAVKPDADFLEDWDPE
ncbi:tudor domain-containing protein [Aureococcus anophagefferens]|nr:tudor domain-containing protein [Aureococcus anophagefferens]